MRPLLLALFPMAACLSSCVVPMIGGETMAPPIEGRVVDRAGQPVREARLERAWSGAAPTQTTTSGADGSFAFSRVFIRHRYYVIGVALNFPVPNTHLMGGTDRIRVSGAGFPGEDFVVGALGPGADPKTPKIVTLKLGEPSRRETTTRR